VSHARIDTEECQSGLRSQRQKKRRKPARARLVRRVTERNDSPSGGCRRSASPKRNCLPTWRSSGRKAVKSAAKRRLETMTPEQRSEVPSRLLCSDGTRSDSPRPLVRLNSGRPRPSLPSYRTSLDSDRTSVDASRSPSASAMLLRRESLRLVSLEDKLGPAVQRRSRKRPLVSPSVLRSAFPFRRPC